MGMGTCMSRTTAMTAVRGSHARSPSSIVCRLSDLTHCYRLGSSRTKALGSTMSALRRSSASAP